MRFQRQARVFRGQLEAAPVAGVVFLLVLFMQLGSLIHMPGVLMHLNNPTATLRIAKDGTIFFGTNTFQASETNLLRLALQRSSAGPPFDLQTDSNTPPRLAAQISKLVANLFPIRVPEGGRNLLATDNPTVVVAVNFLGQYIYDYRIVGEKELRAELTKEFRAVAARSQELTLTVLADEQVRLSAVTFLAEVAHEIGIKDVVYAERAGTPAPTTPPNQ